MVELEGLVVQLAGREPRLQKTSEGEQRKEEKKTKSKNLVVSLWPGHSLVMRGGSCKTQTVKTNRDAEVLFHTHLGPRTCGPAFVSCKLSFVALAPTEPHPLHKLGNNPPVNSRLKQKNKQKKRLLEQKVLVRKGESF